MNNLSRAGKTLLIVIITVSALSVAVHLAKPKIVYVQDPSYVQPPCEAQRRLKEMGLYHGKIDNIWGKESDKAYCDYCAIREIEGK